MGLVPGKPNPRRPCLASPRVEADGSHSRRCTHCLVRQPETHFRWLQVNVRRSSWCKACEAHRRAHPPVQVMIVWATRPPIDGPSSD